MKFGAVPLILITILILIFSGCVTGVPKDEAARAYYNLGNAYFELDEMEKAAEAYLRALSLDETLESASYNLARVYIETGYIDKGIEIINELLEKDPDNTLLMNTAAYAYSLKREYERALEKYEKVLKINEYDDNALFNSGIIFRKQGKLEKAKSRISTLYSVTPEDVSLLFILGKLELDLGNHEKGIRYLESYLEEKPKDEEALRVLGHAYRKQEYYGKALGVYNELLEISEQEPEILFYKAWILLVAIGDTKEGITALEDAVVVGFDDKERYIELINHPDLLNPERVRGLLLEKGAVSEEDLAETSSDVPADDSSAVDEASTSDSPQLETDGSENGNTSEP